MVAGLALAQTACEELCNIPAYPSETFTCAGNGRIASGFLTRPDLRQWVVTGTVDGAISMRRPFSAANVDFMECVTGTQSALVLAMSGQTGRTAFLVTEDDARGFELPAVRFVTFDGSRYRGYWANEASTELHTIAIEQSGAVGADEVLALHETPRGVAGVAIAPEGETLVLLSGTTYAARLLAPDTSERWTVPLPRALTTPVWLRGAFRSLDPEAKFLVSVSLDGTVEEHPITLEPPVLGISFPIVLRAGANELFATGPGSYWHFDAQLQRGSILAVPIFSNNMSIVDDDIVFQHHVDDEQVLTRFTPSGDVVWRHALAEDNPPTKEPCSND